MPSIGRSMTTTALFRRHDTGHHRLRPGRSEQPSGQGRVSPASQKAKLHGKMILMNRLIFIGFRFLVFCGARARWLKILLFPGSADLIPD
jgi:hypothetical protein